MGLQEEEEEKEEEEDENPDLDGEGEEDSLSLSSIIDGIEDVCQPTGVLDNGEGPEHSPKSCLDERVSDVSAEDFMLGSCRCIVGNSKSACLSRSR